MTRIGKLELRVPIDREGPFSTELFEFQRSGLVSALAEMRPGRVHPQGQGRRKNVRAPFSASTVSRINKSLDGLLRRFAQRRLDEAYPYRSSMRYEKVRPTG